MLLHADECETLFQKSKKFYHLVGHLYAQCKNMLNVRIIGILRNGKTFFEIKICICTSEFVCTTKWSRQKSRVAKISHFYCFENTWAEDTAIASRFIHFTLDLEGSAASLVLLVYAYFVLASKCEFVSRNCFLLSNSMNCVHDIIATLHEHWSFRMFIKSFVKHIQLSIKKFVCRWLSCCD